MMTSIEMTARRRWLIAAIAAAVVAGTRFHYESSMPKLVPYDAQGGIWIVVSVVMSSVTFFILLGLGYGALKFFSQKRHVTAILLSLAFFTVTAYTANTLMGLHSIRVALTEAKNPTTPPERLRELIGFQTGFGYEIDNRIAANPNSTADILRILSRKDDQLGTLTTLARNPDTPADILDDLSKNPDKWIQKALEENPKNNR